MVKNVRPLRHGPGKDPSLSIITPFSLNVLANADQKRPSQVRRLFQADNMPVDEAPADEGDGSPRSSYNFAPGYYGTIYRAEDSYGSHSLHSFAGLVEGEADANAHGKGAGRSAVDEDTHKEGKDGKRVRYKLQTMKWGLIPSWSKRAPDYGTLLKTINCRDDSLSHPGGLWGSMKLRKRCVVVAEGFYEWLHPPGKKDKIPHYVKRKDGKLMLFAGLWDCIRWEDNETQEAREEWTYTIITTSSNEQLRFLHDRMPVIFEPGSEEFWRWLDPQRREWSGELQGCLRPFEGELEVYPVAREVGKVGKDDPSFVIPIQEKESKGSIKNFFAKAGKGGGKGLEKGGMAGDQGEEAEGERKPPPSSPVKAVKREADTTPLKGEPPFKKTETAPSPSPSPIKEYTSPIKPTTTTTTTKGKISAMKNVSKSPVKSKVKAGGGAEQSLKITHFFGK